MKELPNDFLRCDVMNAVVASGDMKDAFRLAFALGKDALKDHMRKTRVQEGEVMLAHFYLFDNYQKGRDPFSYHVHWVVVTNVSKSFFNVQNLCDHSFEAFDDPLGQSVKYTRPILAMHYIYKPHPSNTRPTRIWMKDNHHSFVRPTYTRNVSVGTTIYHRFMGKNPLSTEKMEKVRIHAP
jgi:hypothetical protein